MTAEVDANSRLIVRSYDDRDETAEQQEDMIVNGTVAAQVYLTVQADGGTEAAVDVVDYGQNTTVEVTQNAQGQVNMTVERTESQGKVVITSVSDAALNNTDDTQVMVDGEAAVEASSYSELTAAADGGNSSKFMITQSSSADASADVAIALNHFSQRLVTMTDGSVSTDDIDSSSDSDTSDGTDSTATATDDGQSSDGSDSSSSDGSDDSTTATPGANGPGFTGVLALVALVAGLGLAARRNQ